MLSHKWMVIPVELCQTLGAVARVQNSRQEETVCISALLLGLNIASVASERDIEEAKFSSRASRRGTKFEIPQDTRRRMDETLQRLGLDPNSISPAFFVALGLKAMVKQNMSQAAPTIVRVPEKASPRDSVRAPEPTRPARTPPHTVEMLHQFSCPVCKEAVNIPHAEYLRLKSSLGFKRPRCEKHGGYKEPLAHTDLIAV